MGHQAEIDLKARLAQIEAPQIHAYYYHYRNPHLHYQVIALALQEATDNPCVVYRACYGEGLIWVRDLEDWLRPVSHDGQVVARFQQVQG